GPQLSRPQSALGEPVRVPQQGRPLGEDPVVGPGRTGHLLQAAGAGRVPIPTHRQACDRDQPGAAAAIALRPQRETAACGVNLGWRDGKAIVTTGCMTLAPDLPNDVETLKQLIL